MMYNIYLVKIVHCIFEICLNIHDEAGSMVNFGDYDIKCQMY